jgi:hypothetical protein
LCSISRRFGGEKIRDEAWVDPAAAAQQPVETAHYNASLNQ